MQSNLFVKVACSCLVLVNIFFLVFLNVHVLASSTSKWEYQYNIGELSYKVEVLTDVQLALGAAPHWDVERGILYFVDEDSQSVHSYKPSTKEHNYAIIKGNKSVQVIVPVEGQKDKFLITQKNSLAVIFWDGKDSTTIQPEIIGSFEPDDNDNRLHGGKVDPKGRLWTGSMQIVTPESTFPPQGALYSWSPIDRKVKKHFDGVRTPDGIAWSLDNKTMYFADSFTFKLDKFDYNTETGDISNKQIFFNFADYNLTGVPDGMTIDKDGNLFVAENMGGELLHVNGKNGELISKIKLPALQPTAVAFGGINLDELYVTTGNMDEKTFQTKPENKISTDGRLLRITNLGISGLPSQNIQL